jgi:hypothetical protein
MQKVRLDTESTIQQMVENRAGVSAENIGLEAVVKIFEKDTIDIDTLTSDDLDDILMTTIVLSERKKIYEEKEKTLKEFIKKYCIQKDVKEINTKNAEANISPRTDTIIKPGAFIQLAKDMGKEKIISKVIKVSITEAKKYLPIADLDKISEKTVDEFGTLRIKGKS